MSASLEQRSKAQVSNGDGELVKESEFSYMHSQMPAEGDYSGITGMAESDPYMSYYASSYMAYPAASQDEMTAAAMWSSPDQIPYPYTGEYGSVMAAGDYGYAAPGGFGWFAGSDNSGQWGSNMMQGALKDDQQHHHAAYLNSYYGVEMPVYGGSMNGQKDDNASIKSIEQGLKGMTFGGNKSEMNVGGSYINGGSSASAAGISKKATWANIASQPAQVSNRPRVFPRAPMPSGRNGAADYGMWDMKSDGQMMMKQTGMPQPHEGWAASRKRSAGINSMGAAGMVGGSSGPRYAASDEATYAAGNTPSNTVLDKLVNANLYNPKEFDMNPKTARYFIIKSYSEDDIHRSIKYGIWCSTEYGNKRLDSAFHEREGKGPVYLFFSVNGSGHFCGMAEMTSPVDYHASSGVWAQSKWKGQFEVKWIYVKDVPNSQLRHIKLENNENKPVTNSRDTQEVPSEKGKQVLRILHQYRHTTSIFDDFSHYEKRQEEDSVKKDNRRD